MVYLAVELKTEEEEEEEEEAKIIRSRRTVPLP